MWDLSTGAARQTIDRAHSGSDVPCITDLTVWEGHIVSASLDGLIKIWEPADPASGLIINPTPIFTFPEQAGRERGWQRRDWAEEIGTVLVGLLCSGCTPRAVLWLRANGCSIWSRPAAPRLRLRGPATGKPPGPPSHPRAERPLRQTAAAAP